MDMSPCPSTFLKICQFCTVLKYSRFCLFSFQIFVSAFFNFHFESHEIPLLNESAFTTYIFSLLENVGGLARNILARLQFRNWFFWQSMGFVWFGKRKNIQSCDILTPRPGCVDQILRLFSSRACHCILGKGHCWFTCKLLCRNVTESAQGAKFLLFSK